MMTVRIALISLAALALAAPPVGALEPPVVETPGGAVRAYGDLFTEYGNENREDGPGSSAFELTRALVGVDASYGIGIADLELESVRSAGPTSAFGVAGNVLVVRVRRASTGVEPAWADGRWRLRAEAGVLRHPWVGSMEVGFRLRGLGPIGSEHAGLVDAGDVGAQLEGGLFDDRLVATLQVNNGEGRSDIERNDGKNLVGAMRGRVIELDVHRGPLHLDLHAFGQSGSAGAGAARNHRVGGGLTFVGPCPSAGFEYVRAWGAYDDGSRNASVIAAWVESRLATRWAGVAWRFERTVLDADISDAWRTLTLVGLFSDLVEVGDGETGGRLRAYAAYEIERAGDLAGDVAGVEGFGNASRLRIVLELRGGITTRPGGTR